VKAALSRGAGGRKVQFSLCGHREIDKGYADALEDTPELGFKRLKVGAIDLAETPSTCSELYVCTRLACAFTVGI